MYSLILSLNNNNNKPIFTSPLRVARNYLKILKIITCFVYKCFELILHKPPNSTNLSLF